MNKLILTTYDWVCSRGSRSWARLRWPPSWRAVWSMLGSWWAPTNVFGLWNSPYGRILSIKLVVFAAMLALAPANRFILSPRLGRSLVNPDQDQPLAALHWSIALETTLALAVLVLVAYLGLLEPPNGAM